MLSLLNAAVRRDPEYRGLFAEAEYRRVAAYYDARPTLCPTPLTALPALASDLGLRSVLVKDETARFGLESFKITGARYAIDHLNPASLKGGVVCATAGNHGRAVARAARDRGVPCTVYVPALDPRAGELERATRTSRVAGMRGDGATVIDVEGSYEDAVAHAADHARGTGATAVSDTSWPGYEEIPRLIMAGYTRLFDEASLHWDAPPDLVIVQGGVGGLACAAANWFAAHVGPRRPFFLVCEPESAAGLLHAGSKEKNRVPSPEPRAPTEFTMMSGLRCAEPSPAAWPSILAGADAFVAIPDSVVLEIMDRLTQPAGGDPAVSAGPSGACSAGALLALVSAAALEPIRRACGLGRSTRAMVVATEGP